MVHELNLDETFDVFMIADELVQTMKSRIERSTGPTTAALVQA
jgi:hypothetical protein